MQSLRWKLVVAVLLIALVLAAAGLLVPTVTILLLMFVGLLFGIFLNGLAHLLCDRTRVGYKWAYAIVVVLLIVAVSAMLYYMGWQIAGRASQLWSELQRVAVEQLDRLDESEWAQDLAGDGRLREMLTGGDGILPEVMRVGGAVLWGLTSAIVILFVGLYAAFDPHLYQSGIIKFWPIERRTRIREVLDEARAALGRWLIGRLISMTIIGITTAGGLWLLGVPLPFSLGVLAAFLTFVPNIGPILAAIPQALLALNVSTTTVLYVILFNILLQAAESYLITPLIERYKVSLPPALAILVQFLMGILFGPIGLLVAAPLTVTGMVFVQMLYIHDKLGDPAPGELTNGDDTQRRPT